MCDVRLRLWRALLRRFLLDDAGDGLITHQVAQLEVHLQRRVVADARDHLQTQNRVAAQFEEVVADAHLFDLQHLRPDVREQAFLLVARREVLLGLELRFRQRLAIELAVRCHRQSAEANNLRRHHVFRQRGAQARLEFIADVFAACGDHITDQLLAGGTVAGDHQCIGDDGNWRRLASTSPSSMRKPRTLT